MDKKETSQSPFDRFISAALATFMTILLSWKILIDYAEVKIKYNRRPIAQHGDSSSNNPEEITNGETQLDKYGAAFAGANNATTPSSAEAEGVTYGPDNATSAINTDDKSGKRQSPPLLFFPAVRSGALFPEASLLQAAKTSSMDLEYDYYGLPGSGDGSAGRNAGSNRTSALWQQQQYALTAIDDDCSGIAGTGEEAASFQPGNTPDSAEEDSPDSDNLGGCYEPQLSSSDSEENVHVFRGMLDAIEEEHSSDLNSTDKDTSFEAISDEEKSRKLTLPAKRRRTESVEDDEEIDNIFKHLAHKHDDVATSSSDDDTIGHKQSGSTSILASHKQPLTIGPYTDRHMNYSFGNIGIPADYLGVESRKQQISADARNENYRKSGVNKDEDVTSHGKYDDVISENRPADNRSAEGNATASKPPLEVHKHVDTEASKPTVLHEKQPAENKQNTSPLSAETAAQLPNESVESKPANSSDILDKPGNCKLPDTETAVENKADVLPIQANVTAHDGSLSLSRKSVSQECIQRASPQATDMAQAKTSIAVSIPMINAAGELSSAYKDAHLSTAGEAKVNGFTFLRTSNTVRKTREIKTASNYGADMSTPRNNRAKIHPQPAEATMATEADNGVQQLHPIDTSDVTLSTAMHDVIGGTNSPPLVVELQDLTAATAKGISNKTIESTSYPWLSDNEFSSELQSLIIRNEANSERRLTAIKESSLANDLSTRPSLRVGGSPTVGRIYDSNSCVTAGDASVLTSQRVHSNSIAAGAQSLATHRPSAEEQAPPTTKSEMNRNKPTCTALATSTALARAKSGRRAATPRSRALFSAVASAEATGANPYIAVARATARAATIASASVTSSAADISLSPGEDKPERDINIVISTSCTIRNGTGAQRESEEVIQAWDKPEVHLHTISAAEEASRTSRAPVARNSLIPLCALRPNQSDADVEFIIRKTLYRKLPETAIANIAKKVLMAYTAGDRTSRKVYFQEEVEYSPETKHDQKVTAQPTAIGISRSNGGYNVTENRDAIYIRGQESLVLSSEDSFDDSPHNSPSRSKTGLKSILKSPQKQNSLDKDVDLSETAEPVVVTKRRSRPTQRKDLSPLREGRSQLATKPVTSPSKPSQNATASSVTSTPKTEKIVTPADPVNSTQGKSGVSVPGFVYGDPTRKARLQESRDRVLERLQNFGNMRSSPSTNDSSEKQMNPIAKQASQSKPPLPTPRPKPAPRAKKPYSSVLQQPIADSRTPLHVAQQFDLPLDKPTVEQMKISEAKHGFIHAQAPVFKECPSIAAAFKARANRSTPVSPTTSFSNLAKLGLATVNIDIDDKKRHVERSKRQLANQRLRAPSAEKYDNEWKQLEPSFSADFLHRQDSARASRRRNHNGSSAQSSRKNSITDSEGGFIDGEGRMCTSMSILPSQFFNDKRSYSSLIETDLDTGVRSETPLIHETNLDAGSPNRKVQSMTNLIENKVATYHIDLEEERTKSMEIIDSPRTDSKLQLGMNNNELNLSEHELRIQRSLSRLSTVPESYRSSFRKSRDELGLRHTHAFKKRMAEQNNSRSSSAPPPLVRPVVIHKQVPPRHGRSPSPQVEVSKNLPSEELRGPSKLSPIGIAPFEISAVEKPALPPRPAKDAYLKMKQERDSFKPVVNGREPIEKSSNNQSTNSEIVLHIDENQLQSHGDNSKWVKHPTSLPRTSTPNTSPIGREDSGIDTAESSQSYDGARLNDGSEGIGVHSKGYWPQDRRPPKYGVSSLQAEHTKSTSCGEALTDQKGAPRRNNNQSEQSKIRTQPSSTVNTQEPENRAKSESQWEDNLVEYQTSPGSRRRRRPLPPKPESVTSHATKQALQHTTTAMSAATMGSNGKVLHREADNIELQVASGSSASSKISPHAEQIGISHSIRRNSVEHKNMESFSNSRSHCKPLTQPATERYSNVQNLHQKPAIYRPESTIQTQHSRNDHNSTYPNTYYQNKREDYAAPVVPSKPIQNAQTSQYDAGPHLETYNSEPKKMEGNFQHYKPKPDFAPPESHVRNDIDSRLSAIPVTTAMPLTPHKQSAFYNPVNKAPKYSAPPSRAEQSELDDMLGDLLQLSSGDQESNTDSGSLTRRASSSLSDDESPQTKLLRILGQVRTPQGSTSSIEKSNSLDDADWQFPSNNDVSMDTMQENMASDSSIVVRCRNTRCSKTVDLNTARQSYKTCHNCYTYYCSRNCRKSHWNRHKRKCLFSRVSSLTKQTARCIHDDDVISEYMSRVARRGYLSRGRGCITLLFPSIENCEAFLQHRDISVCEYPPTYLSAKELQEARVLGQHLFELLDNCKHYNPDIKYVLEVAILAGNGQQWPLPRHEETTITYCTRLRLISQAKSARPRNEAETLILTAVPGSEFTENMEERKAREICFINMQQRLRQRGVSLRHHYPAIYSKLCAYVADNEAFAPITLYPIDKSTGKRFMCLIMPNSEAEIEWRNSEHLLEDLGVETGV